MGGDEIEPVGIGGPAQRIGQRLAQGQHVEPNLLQLCHPVGAQGVIFEDHRHQTRAMVGRKAVVLAVEEVQVACTSPRRVVEMRDQDARAFAVDAEVLGTGGGDQHLGEAGGDHAGGGLHLPPARRRNPDRQGRSSGTARAQPEGPHGLPHWHRSGSRRSGCGSSHAAAPHRPVSHAPRSASSPAKSTPRVAGVEIAVFGHGHAQIPDDRRMVRPCRVGKPDLAPGAAIGSVPAPAGSPRCRPAWQRDATRSIATASPRISRAMAALKAGSPARPV
jgi:hypothetical protein